MEKEVIRSCVGNVKQGVSNHLSIPKELWYKELMKDGWESPNYRLMEESGGLLYIQMWVV
eukprot:6096507-Karenia_brevis.AAC.2